MAFTKYILPALALAVAGLASAQCDGPSTTVQNSDDTQALQACSTITGDVHIATNAAGTIALNGVQEITGNLVCENAGQLTALSSDQLETIGGIFGLNNLTILSTLQMDSLTSVNQIQWVSLPALQGLNFAKGVNEADGVLISNTQLNTLSGIELMTIGTMDINNNPYLDTVNVNNLANVTNSLSFAANSKTLEITFSNLIGAANLTFRNVSAVTMPSLATVDGSMGFYSNTFQSFAAPNLTSTGGSLAFVDSPNLSNISCPLLKAVGGAFLIANNTDLLSVNGFPSLQVVVGALEMQGTFDNASMPGLKDVRGGLEVETSSNEFSCSQFQQDKDNSIIKGVYQCSSKAKATGSITASGSAASSTGKAKSAAASFDPSLPLTGLGAVIAALLMI